MRNALTALSVSLPVSLSAACIPALATAGEVIECDWQAQASNLAEPWEESTRTFANGAVRLALLDTVEPAAGAFHLLVLSPPYNELGDRQCRVVTLGGGAGFSGIDFANVAAAYDPSIGLIFNFEAQRFDSDYNDFLPITLEVTLNQATGQIGVWHQ
ncbi:MAG: hypothetical protein VX201_05590 [Pseudomonadota bacterium]|nr:hypothetical protein [Pseudomonadota bacterium]